MLDEKIKTVIAAEKVTQEEFAVAVGMSSERVSNLCRGRVKRLRKEEVDAIALRFGISQQWLVNDSGNMMLSKGELETMRRIKVLGHATRSAVATSDSSFLQLKSQTERFEQGVREGLYPAPDDLVRQFVFVPRHQVTASAGHGAVITDETVVDHLAFRRDWVRQSLNVDPMHLALIDARGDSMSPTIESGDLLLLDTRSDAPRNEGIFVINLAGALLVKRLRIAISGEVEVISDNPKYRSETISGSELDRLVLVGRVVWHGRKI